MPLLLPQKTAAAAPARFPGPPRSSPAAAGGSSSGSGAPGCAGVLPVLLWRGLLLWAAPRECAEVAPGGAALLLPQGGRPGWPPLVRLSLRPSHLQQLLHCPQEALFGLLAAGGNAQEYVGADCEGVEGGARESSRGLQGLLAHRYQAQGSLKEAGQACEHPAKPESLEVVEEESESPW